MINLFLLVTSLISTALAINLWFAWAELKTKYVTLQELYEENMDMEGGDTNGTK